MQSKYEDFIQTQVTLRKISLAHGFAITGMTYMEEPHRHQDYHCERGFAIIRVSLDLSLYED